MLGLTSAVHAAASIAGLAPVDMRGLWYPRSDSSEAKCANYLSRDPVEPGAGALVVSEQQMVRWDDHGPTTISFLTDVRPRRSKTWRIQALVDVPPYEAPKVLETYVIEVRKDELHWSARHVNEKLAEVVDTTVFVRCGY
ncbi:hypothetical protein LPB72_10490 [Hydrogenophaga crassostreae]|nr:hypothetical protein LPB72_10490 [Hydrogenophaga crassostreae]